MKNFDDAGKLLLRLSVLLVLFHGIHKLIHGISFIEGLLRTHGLPAWIAYGVYIGEIVAPALIAAGFYARIAAFVLVFNMFMAIMLTSGFYPLTITKTGGPSIELSFIYLIQAVIIFLVGPGKYGINRR